MANVTVTVDGRETFSGEAEIFNCTKTAGGTFTFEMRATIPAVELTGQPTGTPLNLIPVTAAELITDSALPLEDEDVDPWFRKLI